MQARFPEPYFDGTWNAWVVSRYRDVCSILDDNRFVPTLPGKPYSPDLDRHTSARDATLKLTLPDIAFGLPTGEDDLVSFLKSICLEFAAKTVDISADPHFAALAETIFLASAFPWNAALRQPSALASSELAQRLQPQNSIAVQAFVALATSLPAFVASACATLLSHPVELGQLRRDHTLLPLAVEECLRLAGPTAIQFRRAVCNISPVMQDQTVLVRIDDANRDPAIFPLPDRFDLARRPNPHLAFGRGTHACVGASLIRDTSRQLLRKLLLESQCPMLLEVSRPDGVAIRFLPALPVTFRNLTRTDVPAKDSAE